MKGVTHRYVGLCCGVAASEQLLFNPYFENIRPYVVNANMSLTNIALFGSMAVAASYFGGLLPDIDRSSSIIGQRVPFISKPLESIFGHRGLIHDPAIYLAGLGSLLYYSLSFGFLDTTFALILLSLCFGCLIYVLSQTFFNFTKMVTRISKRRNIGIALAVICGIGMMVYGDPYILFCGFVWGTLVGVISHLFIDCFTPKGITIFFVIKIHLGKLSDNYGFIFSILFTILAILSTAWIIVQYFI
jgi:membrane-bound metal-dependent hydrolase YbcI (DUF457 family)